MNTVDYCPVNLVVLSLLHIHFSVCYYLGMYSYLNLCLNWLWHLTIPLINELNKSAHDYLKSYESHNVATFSKML